LVSLRSEGRETLFAGRTVGDVAHRIDRLVGRPGGHHDPSSGERPSLTGRLELRLDRRQDLHRLGHAAGAEFAALGHRAGVRPDEADAVGEELRHVAPGRGMAPHARVHRRSGEHRLVGGQQHVGGEVVAEPVRHLGQEIGGRRRHHHEVRLPRQPDVADLVLARQIEQLRIDPIFAERPDRERRHELLRRRRHHHPHPRAAFAQPADQLEALVGGDAAADDQENALVGEHGVASPEDPADPSSASGRHPISPAAPSPRSPARWVNRPPRAPRHGLDLRSVAQIRRPSRHPGIRRCLSKSRSAA
jgi:hypothetical protein